MKRYKIIFGLLLLCFLLLSVIFAAKTKGKKGDDYRIGIFADDWIAMVSISKSRNMINFLKLNPESKVWIPQGMGWYRSEVVKKILSQEGKKNLYKDLLFYNFGFAADKVVILKKVDGWRSKFWWRVNLGNLISKSEKLEGDSDIESDLLNGMMLRDFSESKVFNEDLKVSVINTSQENGLAAFIANNLERLGFSVVFVSNGEKRENGNCSILYGGKVEESYSWVLLRDLFSNCEIISDLSLNTGEIEFYFGDEFASMIKYSSYKR
jgi:hypothetical protein